MTQPKIDHLEAVRPDSITQTTIDGQSFYAFTLRAGDVQSWDSGNIGPNGKANERAELSLAAAPGPQKVLSPYNVREGVKQTYDIDYRMKAGFPTHDPAQHAWAMITQFHPQDDHRPGVPKGFDGVSIHGNDITLEIPQTDGQYFFREPVPVERTIQRRLVVNWSSKPDGFVKWVDRATGRLLGRYDGQTIAAGEFKYLKQGYYRAGGLPDGTVYSTLMDISDGDLSEMAPVPVQPPAPPPTMTAMQVYAAQLIRTRDAMRKEADAIDALLGRP